MKGVTLIAIYHCSIKIISRGKGQSAVAAAAYRAGEKIANEYDGQLHDYTHKKGVDHATVLLPENAPPEYQDRATLWNAVEQVERAKNSQLAREIQIALPTELSYFQNKALVREFVKNTFVAHGMCADVALHNMDSNNPHAHIMLTMRPINEDGTWGDKQKKVYTLDKDGNKIYDPVKRQYKCSKTQTTDWNEQTKADEWRKAWENYANKHLEQHNHDVRIDCRSHEDRGLEELPTIHLGSAAHQMEQRGIRTDLGDINRAIKLANDEINNINATLLALETELRQLKVELQQQETPSTAPAPFEGYTKAFTAEWKEKLERSKMDTPNLATSKPVTAKNANSKANPAPVPKPKTLKEVNIELDIIETKLSRLEHASSVIMSYNHKIQDIQRNLSSAGFFERRKMQKEISTQEQKRNSYQKDTTKKYGTKTQLESEKSKLLKEKIKIENATGITAAREFEQQQKRNDVIRQQQDRDRYNAERKAKRLENPSKNISGPSL